MSDEPAPQKPIPLDNQSLQVEGQPGVRTSVHVPDGRSLVEYRYEDARTCYESFQRGRRLAGDKPCLGARRGAKKEYVWMTYNETFEKAHKLGSGLLGHGFAPGQETLVGIFCVNSPEWVLTLHACHMYSMVIVPFYDSLGPDACSYILNQTEMWVVVCDTEARAVSLLQQKHNTPSLATIVLVQPISDQLSSNAQDSGVTLLSFDDVMASGSEKLVEAVPPTPDDLSTICYTSGTTGNPKGVMLSHKNIMADLAAIMLQGVAITSKTVYLSYLPLAHVFERMIQEGLYLHGAQIGFFGGDVKLLTEDMQALKPTCTIFVPRLLNRIYDKVYQGVQGSFIKRSLFNLALRKKSELVKQGVVSKSTIWDKLVFGKIQALMGGRLELAALGAAPTSKEVLLFARAAFGCEIYEGYGQTETCGGMCSTVKGEMEGGMVGTPLACNVVKLADVPDYEYFARDGKGEVCCKGTNVMRGYYKDEEKTRETIDADGWLHSGDIGEWLPNGTLRIIDRKKHIFKLAQGEYVQPENVESIYSRSPLVAQAFVDGNSLEHYAVAIIVPDPEVLPTWASKNGLKNLKASVEDLCQNEKLRNEIMQSITKLGKDAGLKGFEQAKEIHLHHELFSVENGLLTPTFKTKRPQLRRYFAAQIEQLYAKNRTPAPGDTNQNKL